MGFSGGTNGKSDFKTAVGNYNFGDDGGAQGAFTIFTVTGDVLISAFGICDVNMAGATATITLGVSGDATGLIGTTTATNLLANEVWTDSTPDVTTLEPRNLNATTFVLPNGQNIILTVAVADLTAGDIDFYALWRPLSVDGLVVAA